MSQSAATAPHSPPLQEAFARVGEPEAEFRPSAWTWSPLLLLYVAAITAAIAAASTLWIWAPRHAAWAWIVYALLCFLTAIVLGVGGLQKSWSIRAERWFVCAGGVVWKHGETAEACAWQDFRSILQGRVYLSTVYLLQRKEAATWSFISSRWVLRREKRDPRPTLADSPQISDLGQLLRMKAETHKIPWNVVAG